MRDIREDLVERIRSIEANMALERQEVDALKRLLDLENARWGDAEGDMFARPSNGAKASSRADGTPLTRVLLDTLGDGKVWSNDDLADAAQKRGIPFGQKNPKRSVNFCLQGLKKAGRVEAPKKGAWRITEN